jgi:hypothetical protein
VLGQDIHRDDKFRQYTLWRYLDRILKDADEQIIEIPYKTDSIVEVLQAVFVEWTQCTRLDDLSLSNKKDYND